MNEDPIFVELKKKLDAQFGSEGRDTFLLELIVETNHRISQLYEAMVHNFKQVEAALVFLQRSTGESNFDKHVFQPNPEGIGDSSGENA